MEDREEYATKKGKKKKQHSKAQLKGPDERVVYIYFRSLIDIVNSVDHIHSITHHQDVTSKAFGAIGERNWRDSEGMVYKTISKRFAHELLHFAHDFAWMRQRHTHTQHVNKRSGIQLHREKNRSSLVRLAVMKTSLSWLELIALLSSWPSSSSFQEHKNVTPKQKRKRWMPKNLMIPIIIIMFCSLIKEQNKINNNRKLINSNKNEQTTAQKLHSSPIPRTNAQNKMIQL